MHRPDAETGGHPSFLKKNSQKRYIIHKGSINLEDHPPGKNK